MLLAHAAGCHPAPHRLRIAVQEQPGRLNDPEPSNVSGAPASSSNQLAAAAAPQIRLDGAQLLQAHAAANSSSWGTV